MKRIIAMLLCLALLGLGTAVAETAAKETIGTVNVNGAFNIRGRIPEGYQVSIVDSDNTSVTATIVSEDATRPGLTLNIVFNDEYTQEGKALRLNDVSAEDMEAIKQSFYDECDEIQSIEEKETAHGTKLLLVKGVLSGRNFVDVYSIYNSYEFEALATCGEEAEEKTLTDEQVQMIIDLFSDIDFEEI